MTEFFNRNPPVRKYVSIWYVKQVLTYIKGLPHNTELSDTALLLKLTALLFLNSARRCHEICYLYINYTFETSSSYKCYFFKITNLWKKGKAPPCLEIHEYALGRSLSVVTRIEEHLK